jgi:phthiodiolone/phenolphthiodiolone dimycocerosates ketoreductase
VSENTSTNAKPLEIGVPIIVDRNFSAEDFGEVVKLIAASGNVDYMQGWDQFVAWFPRSLWTTEYSPMAKAVPDADSFPDWMQMHAYGAALAPELGSCISVDSIRRGPTELTQSMLTHANIFKGKSIFQIGAGELKQCQPYGWKRSQGLKRLEDLYKIFHAYWESNEPVDFEGHYTTLDKAWIGVAKRHRPQLWGLGGGPKIIDLTTSYADGFATMAPKVFTSPEHLHESMTEMKRQLEQKGRDPEAFTFGIWASLLLHEDENALDRALNNKLMLFHAAVIGRLRQADWPERENMPAPMPTDWHYAMKMLPAILSEAEANEWIDRTTPEHVEKGWFTGSPEKVADMIQPFIDAGATWVNLIDIMPFVDDPDEDVMGRPSTISAPIARATPRTLELARLLKERNASGSPKATASAASTSS